MSEALKEGRVFSIASLGLPFADCTTYDNAQAPHCSFLPPPRTSCSCPNHNSSSYLNPSFFGILVQKFVKENIGSVIILWSGNKNTVTRTQYLSMGVLVHIISDGALFLRHCYACPERQRGNSTKQSPQTPYHCDCFTSFATRILSLCSQ